MGRYDPPPAGVAAPAAFRPPRRAAFLLPLVLILVLGIFASWRSRPGGEQQTAAEPASPEVRTVAILPFAYQGPPEDAYLSQGLVTLLATSLHGATNLRALDPYAVLSLDAREGGSAATPIPIEKAAEMAAELGADLILLGSVAASGDGFRLSASLYAHGAPPQRVRTAAIEGAGPAELVDRLARDLLVGELNEPADRLTLVAAATTASVPALKAYLEGEHAFRAARYAEAVEALEQAVSQDPTFALAYYRLSTAAEWSFRFPEARRAARESLELATGLPQRDRRLIGAWHAFVHGDADRAESLYNAVLTDNPDDVEARSGLAEVMVHFNAVRGLEPSAARPHLERVLRVAPDFGEARFHLMEMAAERGDLVSFDSLLEAVDTAGTQGQAWRLARAALGRDSASIAALLGTDPSPDDLVIGVAAVRTAANFRDLEAARALATALTLPERPASWRAAGLIMSAQASLARGDLAEAGSALGAARELEPGWALEIQALGLLLPSSSPSVESLRRAHDDLEAWNPRATNPETAFFFGVHAEAHAELRLYLLTMLDLWLNDEPEGERHLAELRRRGEGPSGIGISLASSAAAHRAWLRDDVEETLSILEGAKAEVPLEHIALSPFFARSLDRYLRAEALQALGRPDEALRWHASLTTGPDLLFWTAAHRRQAELLRDAGQLTAARTHEQRYRSLLDPPPVLMNANQVRAPERLFPIPRADAVGP